MNNGLSEKNWNDLKVYNPDSKCSKCVYDKSVSEYIEIEISTEKILIPLGAIEPDEVEQFESLPGKVIEYNPEYTVSIVKRKVGIINRRCSRCGYRWNERPLDEEPYAKEV